MKSFPPAAVSSTFWVLLQVQLASDTGGGMTTEEGQNTSLVGVHGTSPGELPKTRADQSQISFAPDSMVGK